MNNIRINLIKKLILLEILLICIAVLQTPCLADNAVSTFDINNKIIHATFTGSPLHIDGKLDEKAWKSAPIVDDFHQIDPVEYASPSENTTVQILYNKDFLYIGAHMHDQEVDKIIAKQFIQGQSIRSDDRFEIHIDSFHNQRNGYFFQTSANGVRRDALLTNTRFIDWEGVWYVETHVDENGWTAEFAIPFKTLSFNSDSNIWGINFSRTIPRKQEEVAWSSQNRRLRPANYGDLIGISDIEKGIGLDVAISGTTQYLQDNTLNISDSNTEPSIDFFYKINQSTSAAFTINTDFSATEVDDRQINLTRFSLFLPEKRDFFLKDANIFEFGGIRRNGRPFFSRTIGLDEDGNTIGINYGLKLTGQSQRGSFGILSIQQADAEQLDKKDLNILRANLNILEESSLGFILTEGNPNNNEMNSVSGLDFNYRNSNFLNDTALNSSVWIQQSEDDNTSDNAYGLSFEIPHDTHHISASWSEIGNNFHPALGYINREGIRESNFFYRFNQRPKNSRWRTYGFALDYSEITDLNGNLESKDIRYRLLSLQSHNGNEYSIDFTKNTEMLTEDFEIFENIIIPPGQYDFETLQFEIETSEHRSISTEISLSSGNFYNGKRKELELELDTQITNKLITSVAFSYNDINLEMGNFITKLIRFKSAYSLNKDWSWINFIQYDNETNLTSLNSRLRYFPEPGRELYFVINHGFLRHDIAVPDAPSEFSDISIKISYLFRY